MNKEVIKKNSDIDQQQLEEMTQQLQKITVQLQEKELVLSQTQQKLKSEQQKNTELISQLSEAEEQLQSLHLKLAPSWEKIIEKKYPSLADDLVGAKFSEKPLKICIVTPDIFGPVKNGGIGTAFYHLANLLQNAGHHVTIFYSLGKNFTEEGTLEDWVRYYKRLNIDFVPAQELDPSSAPGPIGTSMKIARKVYDYLKTTSFDIVYASDWKGNCYYALLAKQLGLNFKNTTFCVRTDSPTLWNTKGNNSLVTDINELIINHIERQSVKWADLVLSPSHHLLWWMERHGYKLPKNRCYVQPYVMSLSTHSTQASARLEKVEELVFFGRLEPRKGLQIFCKALTNLQKKEGVRCKVVFLGKVHPQKFDAVNYIQFQAKNWSFNWEILSDYNSQQAINFLKSGNRLAIIPSLLDNSPLVTYECLAEGIPFICSDRGGTAEWIREEDQAEVVCQPHPTKLAKRLSQALNQGIIIARPSFNFEQNAQTYIQWHSYFANQVSSLIKEKELRQEFQTSFIGNSKIDPPLVSVCLGHFNRPKELSQAIESLKNQTYNNYEVILVDDGSDKPDAIAYLDSLEEYFRSRNWQIIRQENLYTGATRNTGARHAKGQYIMFMDDDNYATPQEIETFIKCATYSDADVLTCFADTFQGEEPPKDSSIEYRFTPVGDCVSYGMINNCFGDTNCLVKRSFFNKIGGFTEDYGVGLEDQEFFAKAILSGGQLLVIPEVLYWYRISKERIRHRHFDLNAGIWRVLRPYIDNLPLVSHDLLNLVIGTSKSYAGTKGKMASIEAVSLELQKNFEQIQSIFKKH